MKLLFGALFSLFTLLGCSTVNIIDANPENPADILKSEMSGLSPSQTNTQGSWQSTLDYVNKKLQYGEKIFYSTTFNTFVHARFSNEYTLFEMDDLDIENASIRRHGFGSKKGSGDNRISIPAKDLAEGFKHILASGEASTNQYLVIKVDAPSDSIKVKQALLLMSDPKNKGQ